MNNLLIATMKVDAAIRKQEMRLEADMFGGDDNQFEMGRRRGLEDAYEILVEELREAHPDIVSQVTQIRRIINKM